MLNEPLLCPVGMTMLAETDAILPFVLDSETVALLNATLLRFTVCELVVPVLAVTELGVTFAIIGLVGVPPSVLEILIESWVLSLLLFT